MKLSKLCLSLAVLTALGIGCARIPSIEVLAAVKVVSEENFDESKFDYLGTVVGESFFMGPSAQTGEGNAIATCKGEAYKLGATHIVIISRGGITTSKVVAKAYRKKA